MADKFQFVYEDPSSFSAADDETPYGIYDEDSEFRTDIINVTKWVARRLGHPVMQLEFNSSSIYTCFEEAVSEYSTHINNYNTKNWMWNSYGSEETGSNLGNTGARTVKHPRMGITSVISEQFGEAVGVGGDVTMYSASVTLTGSVQEYDLQSAFSASVSGDTALSGSADKRIVIQQVFNPPRAAITRFWDPFIGTYDQRMMLDQFGFASYSPSTTFILRPIYYDVLRAGMIETSDYIRRANFSFYVVNNKVRLFPIPTTKDNGDKIWFYYYIKDDLDSTTRDWDSHKVSDPSNVPYKFIIYNEINSSGRQWIRKYTLSISKELLGIVRSKYASMPLPGGDVNMDGESLKAEGREEKQQLLEELKEFLESVSLTEKSKAEAEEAEAAQQVLNKAPLPIYIG
tara:strand:+ start:1318 stop:2520 length:1203 start_codon:yes stop_codon:yes gene_type:complete